MPIVVNDYLWKETENCVIITVPLRGINRKNPDIFTSEQYIKTHFKPFIFEVVLFDKVDVEKSSCIVEENQITINLVKQEEKLWGELQKALTKQEILKVKQDAIDKAQAIAKEERSEREYQKDKLNRFAVQRAMDIDSEQLKTIETRRESEKAKAMTNLEEWRKKHEFGDQSEIVEVETKKIPIKREDNKETSRKPKPVKVVQSEFINQKRKELQTRVVPSVRGTSQLDISFTPRSFPTPSRESKAAEEQIWLKNVTAARRATGFVSEDLRPEEQDPQWCKDKGDVFFKEGNFLGAISAYTHGITLSNKLPSLFANRAATHFAMGNFNKCVNDCSEALDLLKPPCEGNRVSRARCIARRAAALVRLGRLNKAIGEMKAASKLLPDDEKIKKDIYDMERAWEQNPDSD